jgi:hypothetical protein
MSLVNINDVRDTPQQRADWARFEAGARRTLDFVHGFDDSWTATLALVALLLADLDDRDARPH